MKEAIEYHLGGLKEDRIPIPKPTILARSVEVAVQYGIFSELKYAHGPLPEPLRYSWQDSLRSPCFASSASPRGPLAREWTGRRDAMASQFPAISWLFINLAYRALHRRQSAQYQGFSILFKDKTSLASHGSVYAKGFRSQWRHNHESSDFSKR
jgi:hypothetical protein